MALSLLEQNVHDFYIVVPKRFYWHVTKHFNSISLMAQ